jgi:hypothetical protein
MNDDREKMNNREKYRQALLTQQLRRALPVIDKPRHLGPADERCPRCGEPIETLFNSDGRNPMRCCWRCEISEAEREYD